MKQHIYMELSRSRMSQCPDYAAQASPMLGATKERQRSVKEAAGCLSLTLCPIATGHTPDLGLLCALDFLTCSALETPDGHAVHWKVVPGVTDGLPRSGTVSWVAVREVTVMRNAMFGAAVKLAVVCLTLGRCLDEYIR